MRCDGECPIPGAIQMITPFQMNTAVSRSWFAQFAMLCTLDLRWHRFDQEGAGVEVSAAKVASSNSEELRPRLGISRCCGANAAGAVIKHTRTPIPRNPSANHRRRHRDDESGNRAECASAFDAHAPDYMEGPSTQSRKGAKNSSQRMFSASRRLCVRFPRLRASSRTENESAPGRFSMPRRR